MNINLFKNTVLGLKNSLTEYGFNLQILDNKVFALKKIEQGSLRFSFSFFDYGDHISIQSPVLEIRLDSIEQKMKTLVDYPSDSFYTVFQHISKNEDIYSIDLEDNIIYMIKDQATAERLLSFLGHQAISDHMEFLNNSGTPLQLYNQLKNLPISKFNTILTNQSNSLFYRALIILLEFNQIMGIEFYEHIISDLKPLKGNSTFDDLAMNLSIIRDKYMHA